MDILIEKGVPMPDVYAKQNRYPFKQMEVGDSFFIPGDGENLKKLRSRISVAAGWWQRKLGSARFVTRVEDDGVRVWRAS